ncbi:MAG: glycosyltransferase [Chryseolinea sp.]
MSQKKSVIFFIGTLEAGGLERFVSRICLLATEKKSFNPIVICLVKKSGIFLAPLEKMNIPVIEAPQGWQRSVSKMLEFSKVLRQLKADIVHTQVNFSLVQQFLIVRLFSSLRFMVTERNCYPLSGISKVKRLIQFYFLKLFNVHYSANSVEVASYLSKMMHYPLSKIPVIANGLDIPVEDVAIRNSIRAKHGWQVDDFVIGYISRFAAHKGHSYFVRVMTEVHKQLNKDLKICFIGDGPVRAAVETQIAQAELKELTTFTGIISNVEEYYQAFDATALLSEYEGMPNVVLEAMAYGLPVIANPVGNVEELMMGDAGIINRSDNPGATAALILDVALHKEKRKKIGFAAQERIRNNFSLNSTLTLLCHHYGI